MNVTLIGKIMRKMTGFSASQFSCRRKDLIIRGIEYRPAGEKLPAVIVSHGFMGNGKSVSRYARALAKAGFASYCFDFCGGSAGRNKSGGKSSEMSVLTQKQDLLAVVDYVLSLPYIDPDRLILMGCSQGGFVSALAAAELKESVHKLVLIFPALCIPDDARAGQMMYARFDPQNIPEQIRCGPMKLGRCYVSDVIGMSPYTEIAPYPGDVLIVHGTQDKIVNVSYSQRALQTYLARPEGTASLHLIEGAGHGFSGAQDEEAIDCVKRFLLDTV